MKTNIKMRVTPEQSAKVQEIARPDGKRIFVRMPFLIIEEDGTVDFTKHESNFLINMYKEVDPDLFIRTGGTCEEQDPTEN